nr:RNA-binding domain-containing protein [uncultured Bacteroides sp.]
MYLKKKYKCIPIMIEVRRTEEFGEYLETLLEKNECDDLEYKSAAGGFPESFWETYSAFANTDGGTILLGVAEGNGKYYLDRLSSEQIEKYRKDFWNNVNNKSTISCNLMKSDNLVIGNFNGFPFMVFFVPRADREQRPIFRTMNPYNGTFKRNHEGDYKCTEKEVQRMFADADTSRPSDSRILRNYSMDDIDKESVQQYRRLFALAKPDHPWLVESDFDLIRKLGGYRKDRVTKEEGFTLAGLLMFGKTEAITDNECCPNFFPDYQERLSDNPDERWSNRICPDGTWEGNLFQFYRLVLPRLQAVLPKPFRLEDNIRRDETPAHVAVREALINLLIHADYSENASLMAQLYKNKIIFSNPGTMLVSKLQYYNGGDSVCRNKALQTMFMMLGTAEKAGSGVDKILKGWREQNWRVPIVETKCQPDRVVLTMRMETVMDDEVKDKLVAAFGEQIVNVGHERLVVLNIACTDGFVTNERLRSILNIHKAEIADLLKDMCGANLLVAEGYGRGTKYYLPDFGSNMATSCANMATPSVNMATSCANMATSSVNMATSCINMATFIKKRMKPEELKELIKSKTTDWTSLEELAAIVNRSHKYLRTNVIPHLIKEGFLEMLFPGVPNHPKQKYKSKK